MTTFSRRQTLAGIAATAAVAALPAMANAAAAKAWTCTGITWDGRHPSSPYAVWWEDRLHWLLWKRVGD
jgi:spermidine/putrescine-binding protein